MYGYETGKGYKNREDTQNWTLHQSHALAVFLLNDEQAAGAQASVVQFTNVLHLVEGKLHGTALALAE